MKRPYARFNGPGHNPLSHATDTGPDLPRLARLTPTTTPAAPRTGQPDTFPWRCDHCGKPEPFNVLCSACEELACTDCGRVECCCAAPLGGLR
jgi:hypothetical protein